MSATATDKSTVMIRVLPRDAFNDANLLKCIGQLVLFIEDGKINLGYEYDGEPFDIVQDESDGSTFVRNISFYTPGDNGHAGELIRHRRPLNSRNVWPLMLYLNDNEYYAFDEKGNFMPNFGRTK
jgi:hypothetical protein